MKDGREYSKKVQKLYRSLKRRYPKVQKPIYDDPVGAIVYAIIGAEMSESAAQSAIKRFTDYFVDWNDLRVTRMEEIVEVLGTDTAVTRDVASSLSTALRAVFSKYDTVSLQALSKMSKRPARQVLEKMDGTNRFVVNYCMLTSLQSHAIPLTKKMIEYLRTQELVHPDADEQEIEGFLARQISVDKAYEFYALLRRVSELRRAGARKKTIRSAKAPAKAKEKRKK
ncbi:MAG: hypothetical protein ACYSSO_00275 [Planctomycetota bacterium]|jgi:endonuclease III